MVNLYLFHKNIDLKILKNKQNTILYIYNNLKIIKLLLNDNNEIFFEKNTNTIVFKKNIITFLTKTFINYVNNLLYSLNFYWNIKIKFKGKGFKIKKYKSKSIKFFFYHSHLNLIVFRKTRIKKIKKTKIILFKNNIKKLNILKKIICKIRPINIYTLRGLRISRQIIFKRSGKKSSYV